MKVRATCPYLLGQQLLLFYSYNDCKVERITEHINVETLHLLRKRNARQASYIYCKDVSKCHCILLPVPAQLIQCMQNKLGEQNVIIGQNGKFSWRHTITREIIITTSHLISQHDRTKT